MIAAVALALTQTEDITLSDQGPRVTLIDALTDAQWQGLVPYLTGYLALAHEGERPAAIATAALPVYHPEQIGERRAQQINHRWVLV